MDFIEPLLETFLTHLNKLTESSKPSWGSMSSQQMIEHLTDAINMSTGKVLYKIQTPEEQWEKYQSFLLTDKEFSQNIEVDFAPKNASLRHTEIELAIDELVDSWLEFDELYEQNNLLKTNHPFYGQMELKLWSRLHSKHFTHHFKQFNLL